MDIPHYELPTTTIYLNSDDINTGSSSLTTANDLFFSTVPISLDPGQTSGDIDLFQLAVSSPLVDSAGAYTGTYTLFGGADGGAQDNLTEQSFTVTTNAPEPSVAWLLLAGTLMTLVPAWKMVCARA